jgi:hypothetical protein
MRRTTLLILLAASSGIVGTVLLAQSWVASRVCDDFPLPNSFSGSGLVLSGHTLACTTLGTSLSTELFLGNVSDQPSQASLVFSYHGAEEPTVQWPSPSELRIAIPRVARITHQVHELAGVKITYSIPVVDYPLPGTK